MLNLVDIEKPIVVKQNLSFQLTFYNKGISA